MSGPANLREENEELRARVAMLEESLGVGWSMPRALVLSPKEERLLAALFKRGRLTRDGAWTAMYHDSLGEYPEPKIIDVFLCRLRKKLKPFGMEIVTVTGRGFEIPESTRETLKQMIETELSWRVRQGAAA
jgi:two-component system cell cycle response regulator CtrA